MADAKREEAPRAGDHLLTRPARIVLALRRDPRQRGAAPGTAWREDHCGGGHAGNLFRWRSKKVFQRRNLHHSPSWLGFAGQVAASSITRAIRSGRYTSLSSHSLTSLGANGR